MIKRVVLGVVFLFFTYNQIFSQKILFDNTKSETASNADWVIDHDEPVPLPAQSGISSSTNEDYWDGAISAWGVEMVKRGYTVATLPATYSITYGSSSEYDLSNYDVFIICEPNNQFSLSEKQALINFVKNGGGLFLVSDHYNADRDSDGWDAYTALNDLFTNNGIDNNYPFGFSFTNEDFINDYPNYNMANLPNDPLLHGDAGDVNGMEFHGSAAMTIYPSINPSVKGVVFKTGASTSGTTDVMVAYSVYGNGKVVALVDSSPADDGTGNPGDNLYYGWTEEDNGILITNATIWLAEKNENIENPDNLQATPVSNNEIDLTWSLNSSSDSVMLAYNLSDVFGTPDGKYSVGDNISGGGNVLYIGTSENFKHTNLSQQTYYYKLWSIKNSNYSSGITVFAKPISPEPDNYPNNFSVSKITDNSISLIWLDAEGNNLPDGYVIYANTSGNFTSPIDGNQPLQDTILADGQALVYFSYGTNSYTFNNLNPDTKYYFKIWSYSNSGNNIDYKIDDEAPEVQASTFVDIIDENFDNGCPPDWFIYSVSGSKIWDCSYGYLYMNAYNDDVADNDWAITPSLDFSNLDSAVLTFNSWTRFSDTGVDNPEVKVKYSTNYDGNSNPEDFEWTELSYNYAPENSQTWTNSGEIILKDIISSTVFIAFQYVSSGTGAGTSAMWQIDSVKIIGATKSIVLQSSVSEIIGLGYELGSSSKIKSFNLTGKNLDGSDVILTASDNFEISIDSVSFFNSITLTNYTGQNQIIYVRMIRGLDIGKYTGNITISGGGASNISVSIEGEVTDSATFVNTLYNEISIFPNPVEDETLFINNNGNAIYSINIYSIEGRKIYSGIIKKGENQIKLHIQGIIIIKIKSDKDIFVQKIVVK